jgi:hypothetical protein
MTWKNSNISKNAITLDSDGNNSNNRLSEPNKFTMDTNTSGLFKTDAQSVRYGNKFEQNNLVPNDKNWLNEAGRGLEISVSRIQPNKELASIESSTVETMESSITIDKIEKGVPQKFDPSHNNPLLVTHHLQDNQIISKGKTIEITDQTLDPSKIQVDTLKSEKENQNSEFQNLEDEKTDEYGMIRASQQNNIDILVDTRAPGFAERFSITGADSTRAQSDTRRINESESTNFYNEQESLHVLKIEGSQTGLTEAEPNALKILTETQTFQKTETISKISNRRDTEEPKQDLTDDNNLENEPFTIKKNEPKKNDDENPQWNKPKIKIEQEVNKELKELSPKHMNNLPKMKTRPIRLSKSKLEVLRLMEENDKLLREQLNLIKEIRAAKPNRAQNILIPSKEELFIQDNKDSNGEADTQVKDESSNQLQIKIKFSTNQPSQLENHRVFDEDSSGSINLTRTIIIDESSKEKHDDKETIQKRTVYTKYILQERIVENQFYLFSPMMRNIYIMAILINLRVEFLRKILLFKGVPRNKIKMNTLRGEETAQFLGDSDEELFGNRSVSINPPLNASQEAGVHPVIEHEDSTISHTYRGVKFILNSNPRDHTDLFQFLNYLILRDKLSLRPVESLIH